MRFDATTSAIDYTIEFVNDDDTRISIKTDYHINDVVTKPSNPTKESDQYYRYQFNGWSPAVTPVTKNQVYKATYRRISILTATITSNYPTSDGKKVETGDRMTYNVSLDAYDETAEFPMTVKIKLDNNVALDLTSLPSNATYDSEKNIITWIAVTETEKLEFAVRVNNNVAAGTTITTTIIEGAAPATHTTQVEETVTVTRDANKNIVLVLDTSGSMAYCASGAETDYNGTPYCSNPSKNRINSLKKVAKEFVKDVLDSKSENEKITISIIAYGVYPEFDYDKWEYVYDPAYIKLNGRELTSTSISAINSTINGLVAYGGTRFYSGIEQATSVLNGLTDEKDFVIFLSDGAADDSDTGNIISNLKKTKATTFAIGFGSNYSTTELNKVVYNNSNHLFSASNAEALETAFKAIAKEINDSQTDNGTIDVDITDLKVLYPIKITYKDSSNTQQTKIISDESGLAINNITIKNNTLTWNIAAYPGGKGFVIVLADEESE